MVELPAGGGRMGSVPDGGRMNRDARDRHIGIDDVVDVPEAAPDRVSRRGLLAAAGGVVGGAAVAAVGVGVAVAAPGSPPAGPQPIGPQPTAFGPVSVRPGDPRYENLLRGNNFRYVGR